MTENPVGTIEDLIDRNPFGFYSEFYSGEILQQVFNDRKIDVAEVTPSTDISDPFEVISDEAIGTNENFRRIRNRLSWNNQDYGKVSYINEVLENGVVTLSHIKYIDGSEMDYALEPQSERFVIKDDPREQSVRIFVNDGYSDILLIPRTPNPTSWSNFASILHQASHFNRLRQQTPEQIKFYKESLGRFDDMIVTQNNLSKGAVVNKADFSKAELIEILRQEHLANSLAIVSINFMGSKLNLPKDLMLEFHKKLIRGYRTYCAWVPIVMAYYD